ncbi:hypothetical protein HZB89_02110, partial [archaeon]|nr:hypothetical protein [archaeon]
LNYLKERKSNSADIINSDYFLGSIYFFSIENEKVKSKNQFIEWLKEAKRVLKPDGRLYLTIEKIFVPETIEAIKKEGFTGIYSKPIDFTLQGGRNKQLSIKQDLTFSQTAKNIADHNISKKSMPVRIVARKPKGV